MPRSDEFQKRFNELIDDFDYSRNELSKLIPISTSTLSNALSYGIIPSVKILMRVADFFELPIEYLLGKSNDNNFIKSSSPTSFQQRFNDLCNEKNVTHYRVAFNLGLNPSIIAKWFTKNYLPEISIIESLCNYFKVSPDYLLGRSDFKN
ncbi:MAG: helix-turn-helix domain-containing protein [Clostridia bacterium]|nr:helix-turn-helix domain-containing protein [Clostridia bacterium]